MSSEAPSTTKTTATASEESRSKRQRAENHVPDTPQDTAMTPVKKLSPLEAALTSVDTYVVTLHEDLRAFTKNSLQDFFKSFSTFFYRNKKHGEMQADGYVPKSCNFELPLIATRDVSQSEDFNTLNSQKIVLLEGISRQLAPFVIKVHDLNRLDAWAKVQEHYVRAITSAARIFIAQFGLTVYGEHLAVMDCLALKQDEVLAPLSLTAEAFLKKYKEVNGLTLVPTPSMPHQLDAALARRPTTSGRSSIPIESRRRRSGQSDVRPPSRATARRAS